MATIAVVGSIGVDEVVRAVHPVRLGAHLDGVRAAPRLGGGAANVAVALAAAGHRAAVVSSVGNDEAGGWIVRALGERGVDTSLVLTIPGPSTRSLVLVDPGGERTIVNLHRCREVGSSERLRRLTADGVYVRSRAGDLALLLEETSRGAIVVAHVPPVAPGSRPAQVLVGSDSDLPPASVDDPWGVGYEVAGVVLEWFVLTRGAAGAVAFGRRGQRQVLPARRVVPVDTTGAGDAFAAGLVHALVSGIPMPRAAEVATAWGAAKVTQEGSSLDRETVERLL